MRIALALVLLSGSAHAAAVCGDRDLAIKSLAERYQEQTVATAISNGGNLVELFASPAGSWTMLVTSPGSNLSCAVGSGTDWQMIKTKPPSKDA
ncbi:MAG: hypothetical protein H0U63_01125 [Burkholderiales bacterium]|nr:hypothetical protein [Burkholderiales bacterium]